MGSLDNIIGDCNEAHHLVNILTAEVASLMADQNETEIPILRPHPFQPIRSHPERSHVLSIFTASPRSF